MLKEIAHKKVAVIAQKEIVDGLRDPRSLIASLAYVLMGPAVVLLVWFALREQNKPAALRETLAAMMSVFTLVAAFVGSMNIAMDTVAGERERQSLLPLLLNPVLRRDVAAGKWLALSFFSLAGLAINLAASSAVLIAAGIAPAIGWTAIIGFVPLALLASASELLISTISRATKEAQTYLSMATLAPMLIGMFLVFFPAGRGWCAFLPVAAQELQLELLMRGAPPGLLQPAASGFLTALVAVLLVLLAADRLRRDEIVYGS